MVGYSAIFGFTIGTNLGVLMPCRAFNNIFQENTSWMLRRSSSLNAMTTDTIVTEKLLPFQKSSHNSVTVVVPDDGDDDDNLFEKSTFKQKLEETVSAIRVMEKSSIWVQVPMSRGSLLEDMVDLGFQFHNAQGNIAKLNLWLPKDIESKVPEFATQ